LPQGDAARRDAAGRPVPRRGASAASRHHVVPRLAATGGGLSMARGAQIAVITRYVGDDGPFYEDRAFLREIRAINKKFAQRMKRSFGETVRTWEDKPKFRQE